MRMRRWGEGRREGGIEGVSPSFLTLTATTTKNRVTFLIRSAISHRSSSSSSSSSSKREEEEGEEKEQEQEQEEQEQEQEQEQEEEEE